MHNPLVSRVDVTFKPLDTEEADQERLVEARRLFLVAVAQQILQGDEYSRFKLSTEEESDIILNTEDGTGGIRDLPGEPTAAAYLLYQNKDWMRTLSEMISRHRAQVGMQEFVMNIHGMLKNPAGLRLQIPVEKDAKARISMNTDVLLGYVKPDPQLLSVWETSELKPSLLRLQIPATYYMMDFSTGGPHAQTGYYCDICGFYFGNFTDQEGKPDASHLPSLCPNHLCGS
jgi:hypothetical protein